MKVDGPRREKWANSQHKRSLGMKWNSSKVLNVGPSTFFNFYRIQMTVRFSAMTAYFRRAMHIRETVLTRIICKNYTLSPRRYFTVIFKVEKFYVRKIHSNLKIVCSRKDENEGKNNRSG